MLIWRPAHNLAQAVVRVRLRTEENNRLVGLGTRQEAIQRLGALSDAGDQHTRCEGVQCAAMPDLHLDFLVSVASAVFLVAALFLAGIFLSLDPWPEKLRRVEVTL